MATWKKIREKLLNGANDITIEQVTTLLKHYGYEIDNKGKTSGSRILFYGKDLPRIYIHKPHPEKEVNKFCLEEIKEIILGIEANQESVSGDHNDEEHN